jgi:hypothetical protein
MAGAEVDQDFFATNDAGDLLTSVVVFENQSTEWCRTPSPAALVWSGHDGSRRSFTGDVMARMIAPATGGFVVGAVRADCTRSATGPHGSPDAYLVTGAGRTVEITWPAGSVGDEARRVCASDPTDPRCVFSADDGTVRFRPRALVSSSGGTPLARGDLLVVPPTEHERLWWSTDDGASWALRESVLAYSKRGGIYTTGDVPVMSNGTEVEFTSDAGRTWSVRHLSATVEQVGVTTSGALLAVVPPANRNAWSDYRVVRSTDAEWSGLAALPMRAWLGPLWLDVRGDAVYVFNHPDVWWISTDAGVHWRVVAPLADRR